MFTLCIERDFVTQHYLVGGDWGPFENTRHSHHYRMEIRLEGTLLDQHGYLMDLVRVEQSADAIVSYFRDQTINELPEFAGLNPSIEHFARIICHSLIESFNLERIDAISVRLWEGKKAWVSYRQTLPLP